MEKIVQTAFTVDQMANGNRKNNTVWLYPKTRKQDNSNDCGYYVMKNMLDIVTAKITESWME
ncbi:Ulp1 protease family carboxy-terminal domain protein, partial [Trifolium medium]|nr:Ulp1 protease family carboxy-terminal domain protein [Trifolium medium]